MNFLECEQFPYYLHPSFKPGTVQKMKQCSVSSGVFRSNFRFNGTNTFSSNCTNVHSMHRAKDGYLRKQVVIGDNVPLYLSPANASRKIDLGRENLIERSGFGSRVPSSEDELPELLDLSAAERKTRRRPRLNGENSTSLQVSEKLSTKLEHYTDLVHIVNHEVSDGDWIVITSACA